MRPEATLPEPPVRMCPSYSTGRSNVLYPLWINPTNTPWRCRRASRNDASALEGFPRCLQQQPLLRIHRERFARTDVEERSVEVAGLVQEAALTNRGLARCVGIGIVQDVRVPTALEREIADRVDSVAQQRPQRFRGVNAAG